MSTESTPLQLCNMFLETPTTPVGDLPLPSTYIGGVGESCTHGPVQLARSGNVRVWQRGLGKRRADITEDVGQSGGEVEAAARCPLLWR